MLENLKKIAGGMFHEKSLQEEPIIVANDNTPNEIPGDLAAVQANVAAMAQKREENPDVLKALNSIQEEGVPMSAGTQRSPSETMMPKSFTPYRPPTPGTVGGEVKLAQPEIPNNVAESKPEVTVSPEESADKARLTEMAQMRQANAERDLNIKPLSLDGLPENRQEESGTSEITATLDAIHGLVPESNAPKKEVAESVISDIPKAPVVEEVIEVEKVDEPFVIPTVVASETEKASTNNVVEPPPTEITQVPAVETNSGIEEVGEIKASNDNDIEDLSTAKAELSLATEKDFASYFEGSTGDLDEMSVKAALAKLISSKVEFENVVGDARTKDGRPLIEILEGLATSSASKQALASAIEASYNIKSAA